MDTFPGAATKNTLFRVTVFGAPCMAGELAVDGGDPGTGWNARAAAFSGVCWPAGAGGCAACERSVGGMMIESWTR